VWVGLLGSSRSDFDKLTIGLKVFNGFGATVTHASLQASYQLVQDF
jgi:hypothetical protein